MAGAAEQNEQEVSDLEEMLERMEEAARVALMTPAMELVPFSANGAGLVLTAFGLALIAHDGLISLVALVIAVATAGLIVYNLL